MSDKILVQAGMELVRMLISGAINMAKTLSIPDEKIDEEFKKAKEAFDKVHGGWEA